MELPLVSVLMPAYNAMPLVQASVMSLINQTYSRWECIVVDDGSTDGTSEYLDSLQDSRFVIHHFRKNKGRPAARQKTLEMAKGDYIAMLDAGDLYHPMKLEKQVKLIMSDKNLSLIATAMCSFGTKVEYIRVRGKQWSEESIFYQGVVPPHATCLLRAAIAKKMSYNPMLKLGEDVDFLERYLNGRFFKVINQPLYYYSEFDSVTKNKIKKTYQLYYQKYWEQRAFKQSAIYFSKYLASVFIFPFVSTQSILDSRSEAATAEESKDYHIFCRSLINNL